MESLRHLPESELSKRKPPPKIELVGISVLPSSGLSRQIAVNFRYTDDIIDKENTVSKHGIINSTLLGEAEIEAFFAMSPKDRKEFLLSLGEREWYATEEVRLMSEVIVQMQSDFDKTIIEWTGTDLLRNEVSK